MPFILWVVDEMDKEDVLKQIDSLDSDVVFTWGYDEIREILQGCDPQKREEAESFISFFEGKIDRDMLGKF